MISVASNGRNFEEEEASRVNTDGVAAGMGDALMGGLAALGTEANSSEKGDGLMEDNVGNMSIIQAQGALQLLDEGIIVLD